MLRSRRRSPPRGTPLPTGQRLMVSRPKCCNKQAIPLYERFNAVQMTDETETDVTNLNSMQSAAAFASQMRFRGFILHGFGDLLVSSGFGHIPPRSARCVLQAISRTSFCVRLLCFFSDTVSVIVYFPLVLHLHYRRKAIIFLFFISIFFHKLQVQVGHLHGRT